MGISLLVGDPATPEPMLGPGVADRLAELGITHVSVLRDALGVGLVLEGWAFDPADVELAIRAVFPSGAERVRALHEVGQVALARSGQEGRSA